MSSEERHGSACNEGMNVGLGCRTTSLPTSTHNGARATTLHIPGGEGKARSCGCSRCVLVLELGGRHRVHGNAASRGQRSDEADRDCDGDRTNMGAVKSIGRWGLSYDSHEAVGACIVLRRQRCGRWGPKEVGWRCVSCENYSWG